MSAVINNLKLSISSSKISPDIIEGFFILIINNKHTKSILSILQFLLGASATSINIPNYSSYQRINNLNTNNKSDKNKIEIEIKLEDKINKEKSIY